MKKWEPELTEEFLNEKFYVRYLGTSDRNTLLWVDISGTTYVYSRAPGADKIKEIARKFRKMMQYAKSGGRALAWLKKNTEMVHKMPTKEAHGQYESVVVTAEDLIESMIG